MTENGISREEFTKTVARLFIHFYDDHFGYLLR